MFYSPREASKPSVVGKAELIQQVLSEPEVDLWKLRELALSEGGLVNDTIRRRAWPKLIGMVVNLDDPDVSNNANNPSRSATSNPFISVVSTYPQRQQSAPAPLVSFQERRRRVSASDEASTRALAGDETDNLSTGSFVLVGESTGDEQREADEEGVMRREYSPHSRSIRTGVSSMSTLIRSSQLSNLHRDDISISSNTTASVSNMSGGKRFSLPILATSLDFRQIDMDVQRCTWHLLTGDQRIQRLQMEHKRNRKVARLIRRKQRRLANLINYTLVQSYPQTSPDKLRYYQGFHDVACIFMSVLGGSQVPQTLTPNVPQDMQAMAAAMGLDLPARVLAKVSQSHLRDFLKSDFKELQTAIELTVFPLIAKLDMEVHDCLRAADMQPFFSLSWVITWFAHEVRDTVLVKRLFDVFLVSHPLMPIYLSVAMVLHPTNREVVLGVERDFGTIHQTLRNLTKNSSMAGWKYRPGDGYVSDDGEEEDEGDEDDGREDSIEQAGARGDYEKIHSELVSIDANQTTMSSISTCADSLAEGQTRVPFQDLIDLALDIMRRIPPRKLLPLSVRYFGGPHVAALLAHAPNIRLFSDPPRWAVRSKATADWVMKLRSQKSGVVPKNDHVENQEPLREVLLRKSRSPAIIALGFGEGEDKSRRRKRKRHTMVFGAIGVAVVAVAIGVVIKNYGLRKQIYPASTNGPEDPTPSTKELCSLRDFTADVSFLRSATGQNQPSDIPKPEQEQPSVSDIPKPEQPPILHTHHRVHLGSSMLPSDSQVPTPVPVPEYKKGIATEQSPSKQPSNSRVPTPFPVPKKGIAAEQPSSKQNSDSRVPTAVPEFKKGIADVVPVGRQKCLPETQPHVVITKMNEKPSESDTPMEVIESFSPSKQVACRIGESTARVWVKVTAAGRRALVMAEKKRKALVADIESFSPAKQVASRIGETTARVWVKVTAAGRRALVIAEKKRKALVADIQSFPPAKQVASRIGETTALALVKVTAAGRRALVIAAKKRQALVADLRVALENIPDTDINVEEEFGRHVLHQATEVGQAVVALHRYLLKAKDETFSTDRPELNEKLHKTLRDTMEFLERPFPEGMAAFLGWLNEPIGF